MYGTHRLESSTCCVHSTLPRRTSAESSLPSCNSRKHNLVSCGIVLSFAFLTSIEYSASPRGYRTEPKSPSSILLQVFPLPFQIVSKSSYQPMLPGPSDSPTRDTGVRIQYVEFDVHLRHTLIYLIAPRHQGTSWLDVQCLSLGQVLLSL